MIPAPRVDELGQSGECPTLRRVVLVGWRHGDRKLRIRPAPAKRAPACASCRCLVPLVDGRCLSCRPRTVTRTPVLASRVFVSAPDIVTRLAEGHGPPDARFFELDEWGRRAVVKWARRSHEEPVKVKPPKAKRASRAKPHEPDPRVPRPISKEDERQALELLATRYVRPAFIDRDIDMERKCKTCGAYCRCEWRAEVWLELLCPPSSVAHVDDIELRVERAVNRAESRARRAWGKI